MPLESSLIIFDFVLKIPNRTHSLTLSQEHLKRIPDLDRLAKKFQRSKAALPDCVALYQFIVRLPVLCEVLASHDGAHKPLIEREVLAPIQVGSGRDG